MTSSQQFAHIYHSGNFAGFFWLRQKWRCDSKFGVGSPPARRQLEPKWRFGIPACARGCVFGVRLSLVAPGSAETTERPFFSLSKGDTQARADPGHSGSVRIFNCYLWVGQPELGHWPGGPARAAGAAEPKCACARPAARAAPAGIGNSIPSDRDRDFESESAAAVVPGIAVSR
jgi:hypothetical protein